jgi:hypothetical protein
LIDISLLPWAALGRAQTIATAQSKADPANAIFRSDAARSSAVLATAQAQSGDSQAATLSHQEALQNWSNLREAKSISAEDAHRSDEAKASLAALRTPR